MTNVEKMMRDIANGLMVKIEEDTPISFKCTVCGKCCTNQDIILTTWDIIRMRHSLHMTTNEMISKDLIAFTLGAASGVPIALLKFNRHNLPDGGTMTICPFLSPVKKLDEEQLEKIQGIMTSDASKEDIHRVLFDIPILETNDGEPVVMCGIYNDRPLRCRLWPLGRVLKNTKDAESFTVDNSWDVGWYLLPKMDWCPGYDATETVMREQFIKDAALDDYLEESDRMYSWFETIRDNELLAGESSTGVVFGILYNFDPFITHMYGKGVEVADIDIFNRIEVFINDLADIHKQLKAIEEGAEIPTSLLEKIGKMVIEEDI